MKTFAQELKRRDLLNRSSTISTHNLLRRARAVLAPSVNMREDQIVMIPPDQAEVWFGFGLSDAEEPSLGSFVTIFDRNGNQISLTLLSDKILGSEFEALRVLCHEIAHARQGPDFSRFYDSELGRALTEGSQAAAEFEEFKRLLASSIGEEVEALIRLEYRIEHRELRQTPHLDDQLAALLQTPLREFYRDERRFTEAVSERAGAPLRIGDPIPFEIQSMRDGFKKPLSRLYGRRPFEALHYLLDGLRNLALGRQPYFDKRAILSHAKVMLVRWDSQYPFPTNWRERIDAFFRILIVLWEIDPQPTPLISFPAVRMPLHTEATASIGIALMRGVLSLENIENAIAHLATIADLQGRPGSPSALYAKSA